MLQHIPEFLLANNQALCQGTLSPYGFELGPILSDYDDNMLAAIYRVAGRLYLTNRFPLITPPKKGEATKLGGNGHLTGFGAVGLIESTLPMGEILQHFSYNLKALGEGTVAVMSGDNLVAKTNRAGQFFQDVFYKIGV